MSYNTIIRLCFTLFVLAAVSGCASLSKSECNQGDWAKIGERDGQRGLLAKQQLSKHRSACARYQKAPDLSAFNRGYNSGLKTYCVAKVGFNQGSQAYEYLGVCPAGMEKEFLGGYVSGLELAMDNTADEIDRLRFHRYRTARKLDSVERHPHRHHPRDNTKDNSKDKSKGDDKHKSHKKLLLSLESRLDNIRSALHDKRRTMSRLRTWHALSIAKLHGDKK